MCHLRNFLYFTSYNFLFCKLCLIKLIKIYQKKLCILHIKKIKLNNMDNPFHQQHYHRCRHLSTSTTLPPFLHHLTTCSHLHHRPPWSTICPLPLKAMTTPPLHRFDCVTTRHRHRGYHSFVHSTTSTSYTMTTTTRHLLSITRPHKSHKPFYRHHLCYNHHHFSVTHITGHWPWWPSSLTTPHVKTTFPPPPICSSTKAGPGGHLRPQIFLNFQGLSYFDTFFIV